MKLLLVIFFTLPFSYAFGYPEIKIYHEETDNGYKIYADNPEYCTVSIEIKFDLLNLNSTNGNNKLFVLPPHSNKINITDLVRINNNEDTKFSYKVNMNYGNDTLTTYDQNFKYYLPFKKGKKFIIYQGYNGKLTHKNENAIDFGFPLNTEIYAARGGVVVKVVTNNDTACFHKSCDEYNNFILIYHADGTFGSYVHIKKNGSIVNIGDSVKTGDLIGYSGNVGMTNGPHLHFDVALLRMDEKETVKTFFLVASGKAEILVERKTYLRNY